MLKYNFSTYTKGVGNVWFCGDLVSEKLIHYFSEIFYEKEVSFLDERGM